jgi:hypothetical protein
MILSIKNSFPKDKRISFEEEDHVYTIDGKNTNISPKYLSVTTWIDTLFSPFDPDKVIENMMNNTNWTPENKYWNMKPEEIKKLWNENGKKQSKKGSILHSHIEFFMNQGHYLPFPYTHQDLLDNYNNPSYIRESLLTPNTPYTHIEWNFFLDFVKDHPHFIPYRTEWFVFMEKYQICGAIDMVYRDPDNLDDPLALVIYDWKRSKEISQKNIFHKFSSMKEINHIPNTNFGKYSLQLNIYKTILESYGFKINKLCLVRLHPDFPNPRNKSYELINVPFLHTEINTLLHKRLSEIKS